ncbi:ABC transporter substrate-binding protein, partial [bacterium]|nr:ABC transporter substrate-binding protein [bacterium]
EMASVMNTIPTTEEGNAFDPHFWLDPKLAKAEIALIRDTLMDADPANAKAYAANAAAYTETLAKIDAAYETGLSACKNPTVVTSHAALAYVAKEYGFDVISIAGLSPDEEPSAGRLAEIAAMVKAKKIGYIYFETLVSPKLAQTIAEEVGAQTLVFNPLEGLTEEETAAGKTYVSVMEENLANLKTGMMCE